MTTVSFIFLAKKKQKLINTYKKHFLVDIIISILTHIYLHQ